MNDSKARKPAARNGKAARKRSPAGKRSAQDAIALLKSDHRQVEDWFQQFQKARSDARKTELAAKICAALKTHTSIEEEMFYPAFLEATGERDIHHEAEVEHEGAKRLIADIEKSGPEDDYYDAKVKVLSEMIKHHVKEEEKRGGMFTKARQSDMDLKSLGEQLAQRKQELMGAAGGKGMSRRASAPRATSVP
ncbi:MAG TPA: hemerythrin domain-containing protein [Gammaproteobacteria bacterium]|nr:hemerythrin domain-containing protein [Gammaproteobacteria bacterium]